MIRCPTSRSGYATSPKVLLRSKLKSDCREIGAFNVWRSLRVVRHLALLKRRFLSAILNAMFGKRHGVSHGWSGARRTERSSFGLLIFQLLFMGCLT